MSDEHPVKASPKKTHVNWDIKHRHHTPEARAFQKPERWQRSNPRRGWPDKSKEQAGGPYSWCRSEWAGQGARRLQEKGGQPGSGAARLVRSTKGSHRAQNSEELYFLSEMESWLLWGAVIGFDYRETAVRKTKVQICAMLYMWSQQAALWKWRNQAWLQGVWPGRPGSEAALGGWGKGQAAGESRAQLGVHGVGRAAHQLGENTQAQCYKEFSGLETWMWKSLFNIDDTVLLR